MDKNDKRTEHTQNTWTNLGLINIYYSYEQNKTKNQLRLTAMTSGTGILKSIQTPAAWSFCTKDICLGKRTLVKGLLEPGQWEAE